MAIIGYNYDPDIIKVTFLCAESKVEPETFTIKEWGHTQFKFPYLTMVKGGNEIVQFDLSANKIYYFKSNVSIVATSESSKVYGVTSGYECLMDLGDFYVYQ